MSRRTPKDSEALRRRLERLSAALGPPPPPRPAAPPPVPLRAPGVSKGGVALGVALVAVGIATSQPVVTLIGALLILFSAALRLGAVRDVLSASQPALLAPKDPMRPHIGMGAEVAEDAVIEPGATVEMGATVHAGAVVKSGAVVRMGATVGARAVLEAGAVVGYGADVDAGATVGQGALVGAGSTVKAGAHVPAGTRMMPGSTWSPGMGARAEPKPAQPAPVQDPREARLLAACERIEAELRQAPEQVREFLGVSSETASGLRETCLGLLQRERMLRQECSPESLAFLDKEKAELEQRIAQATDPLVRQSLTQAVAAIDDQRRQRGLMHQNAERLDAELTRLMWTLDGMGAQLMRLRTAGPEAAGALDAEALRSVHQLHDEIDAIAEALDHVSRGDLQPISAIDETDAAPSVTRSRERT
jgi:carbonic anhydrase/acetyltransferase-like protein (isoleucine patch superfamily)